MTTLTLEQNVALEQTLFQLNQKLDRLATQVDYLTETATRQQRRQQEWDELQNDLMPIGNEVFRLAVQELEEVQQHAQLEDILRLVKRLLRNTRNLEVMLDQLESASEMWQDVSPLSRTAFLSAMQQLALMEQKGYFTFLQGGLDLADKVVTSFDEDDIEQLSNNIVLILETVKEMTQPEIMAMMRNVATVARDDEPTETSMLGLLRQLNDPAVRKGLAKTLQMVKSVGE